VHRLDPSGMTAIPSVRTRPTHTRKTSRCRAYCRISSKASARYASQVGIGNTRRRTPLASARSKPDRGPVCRPAHPVLDPVDRVLHGLLWIVDWRRERLRCDPPSRIGYLGSGFRTCVRVEANARVIIFSGQLTFCPGPPTVGTPHRAIPDGALGLRSLRRRGAPCSTAPVYPELRRGGPRLILSLRCRAELVPAIRACAGEAAWLACGTLEHVANDFAPLSPVNWSTVRDRKSLSRCNQAETAAIAYDHRRHRIE